ncbi:MAG: hypothetical protein RR192_04105 [Peptostreptococcaceae bacterium]
MSLKVKSLDEHFRPGSYDEVRTKEMGNIIELMYSDRKNHQIVIKKINDNEYIDLRTGEVKEFQKIDNRACDMNSIRQSLGRLRDLLNTNITDTSKCRWVTLTYKENMTDPKRLYKDFERFNKRMKYALSKEGHKYEYIVAMEPQGRGAWHAHLVMIFEDKAPYIENSFMADTWGQGFTVTKKLEDVDNVGAYLTAYLGDMDMNDYKNLSDDEKNSMRIYGIKEVDIKGSGEKKSVLKGARLHMYPPKFNLYRSSRGVKKPIVTYETEKEAQKKISAGTLTFEKTIEISDSDSQFCNKINYRHYNLIRE